LVLIALAAIAPNPIGAAEAFELGEHSFSERPLGKEADGIVGDFVLRNAEIEAVISGNLPLRRANMSTFYGANGMTPGCLYDLTLRGDGNDQLVALCPLNQRGPINSVRIVEAGGRGRDAVVEVYRSAAKGGGVSVTHTYRLRDGEAGLHVRTVLRNETAKVRSRKKQTDVVVKFRKHGQTAGVRWFDAIDPADRCGYAVGAVEGSKAPPEQLELAPGESLTFTRYFAVGRSPAEAFGRVARLRGDTGSFHLKIVDAGGRAVPGGWATLQAGEESAVPAYPDADGNIHVDLPPGVYQLAVGEIGRATLKRDLRIETGKTTTITTELGPAAAIRFNVTGDDGGSLPCKVQFNPLDGTPSPELGPTDRAHGCVDQYHSETGAFRVQVPPGTYDVVVTRGPEYSHYREKIQLGAGESRSIRTQLTRLVNTKGWVSTDYHNHSTPSGDNTCGTDDRLINLAAEHIEFAPTTEHNRLYDWSPHIDRLGLAPFVKTVPGLELTGRGPHLNSFPFTPHPMEQDGGAPVWQRDPRLNAIVLRDFQGSEPDRWVQLNHPDMSLDFVDRNGDGKADGGFAYFEHFIDALETQNFSPSGILAGAPYSVRVKKDGKPSVRYIHEFIWLQLLNQGLAVWGIAVSDAHHVHGNGVGGWRTYVSSSTDDPAKIDWRELSRNSKAGRMTLSTGPFLEVETGSGVGPGGQDRVSGELRLKVRVECTDWLDIDRVQVLVNGRQDPAYNFTRASQPEMFSDDVVKFDHVLSLDLSQDAQIIVVAIGEKHTLKTGFGSSSQSDNRPIAYNNPIFVDVDGGGFTPNYDTLGFDLPVKKLTVKEVEKTLHRR